MFDKNRRPDTGEEFSAAAICAQLKPGVIGAEIEFHAQIDSTNNRAKQLAAQGAPHGMLVIADSQTAGRGRFDRKFHSPASGGIYISIILRPDMDAACAVRITPMAAVAVARAIERTAGIDAQIKWVNDVYIGGRKVCGILCEGVLGEGGRMASVVLGIGVNVAPMDFPPELSGIATSVSNACGRSVPRMQMLAALVEELRGLYPKLENGGFMDEYRARSNVIGRDVNVLQGGARFAARAVDIDGEGSLIVELPDGRREALRSGEISIRFA